MAKATVPTRRRQVSTKEERQRKRAGVKAFYAALARERELREGIAELRAVIAAVERVDARKADLRESIERQIDKYQLEADSLNDTILKACARG